MFIAIESAITAVLAVVVAADMFYWFKQIDELERRIDRLSEYVDNLICMEDDLK